MASRVRAPPTGRGMSAPVFISYNFRDDKEFARGIRNFFQPFGPCHGVPHFVENDVSERGLEAIDAEIRSVMSGCVAAVFVCGQNTHDSPWINREAKLAISRNLGIVVLRAPGSTGGIPNELRALTTPPPLVDWGPEHLCSEINRIVSARGSNR